jgi:hypothetical protein
MITLHTYTIRRHCPPPPGRDKDSARPPSGASSGFSHAVSAVAFGPSSTRLAVGQSDGTLFVYRLGAGWGARKSICNKFRGSSPVRAVAWPPTASLGGHAGGQRQQRQRPGALDEGGALDDGGPDLAPATQGAVIVFGCEDGRIKLGNTLTNRSALLHDTRSPCLAACHDGAASALTAHADGAVYRFSLDESGASRCKLLQCVGMPLCLTMGGLLLPGTGAAATGMTARFGGIVVSVLGLMFCVFCRCVYAVRGMYFCAKPQASNTLDNFFCQFF